MSAKVYGTGGIEAEHIAFIERVLHTANDTGYPDYYYDPDDGSLEKVRDMCQEYLEKHKQARQALGEAIVIEDIAPELKAKWEAELKNGMPSDYRPEIAAWKEEG